MITAFQRGAFQTNAFQIEPTLFIHDGGDEVRRRAKRTDREDLRALIEYAFDGEPQAAEEVRAIAAPFVQPQTGSVVIDWKALRASVSAELRLRTLYEQYAAELAERDDEEALMVL